MREIRAHEVAHWVPHALSHMVEIRCESKVLAPSSVESFLAQGRAAFKAGMPRYARIVVSGDLDHWLWMDTSQPRRLVDAMTQEDPQAWAEVFVNMCEGESTLVELYPGDSSRTFLGYVRSEPIEVTMHVCLREKATAKVGRVARVELRPMRMDELGDFVSRIAGARDASCGAEGGAEGSVGVALGEANCAADLIPGRGVGAEDIEHVDRIVGRHSALTTGTAYHVPLERMLEDGVSTPGHEVLAIVAGTEVIGGIWCEVDGAKATIWRVCIYHGNRGKGFFAEALAAFLDRMRGEHVRHLGLTIAADNAPTIEIFRSLGFDVVKELVLAHPEFVRR